MDVVLCNTVVYPSTSNYFLLIFFVFKSLENYFLILIMYLSLLSIIFGLVYVCFARSIQKFKIIKSIFLAPEKLDCWHEVI